MAEEINARIRHVGKTQAEWLSDDTVLLAGELGYATDTQVIKVGNGQDVWRDLKSHQGEQGPQGDIGPEGPQGPKGEPFTYEDLTEEQRLEIRGAEIDTSGFVSRAELSEAIENVDVSDQLASKADVNHTHEIDAVNGLQDSLNSKAGIDHTHSEYVTQSQAEDQFATSVRVDDNGVIQYKRGNEWKYLTGAPKVALDTHSHDDRYSKIGHTHTMTDVLGLHTYLKENFLDSFDIYNMMLDEFEDSLDSLASRVEVLEKLVEEQTDPVEDNGSEEGEQVGEPEEGNEEPNQT